MLSGVDKTRSTEYEKIKKVFVKKINRIKNIYIYFLITTNNIKTKNKERKKKTLVSSPSMRKQYFVAINLLVE